MHWKLFGEYSVHGLSQRCQCQDSEQASYREIEELRRIEYTSVKEGLKSEQ